MKICVINGSPRGKYSTTLQTSLYLEKRFVQHRFTYLHVGAGINTALKNIDTMAETIKEADLVIFSYPVYTFIAPSQLHRFIAALKRCGADLSGICATQMTTSKHFYDMTAHRYVEENMQDMGMKVIHGLSADMDDLLTEQGQKDAEKFFRYVCWCVKNDIYEAPAAGSVSVRSSGEKAGEGKTAKADSDTMKSRPCTDELPAQDGQAAYKAGAVTAYMPAAKEKQKMHQTVIVADLHEDDLQLKAMIEDFRQIYPYETKLVNIAEYPFKGGCLGCFNCAGEGKCIYQDGFDVFLREKIQRADAIVYAFTITDHSMGPQFKTYDDRQFCNGHRTVTEGMPFGYIINGNYAEEENLKTVIEARAQVGHNFLAGAGCDGKTLADMTKRLVYALEKDYLQPRNFWGVGGMKIFRDLIWMMRGLMKADHEFYKAHGVYDFPQKQTGKMLKMCVLGSLVRNPKIKAKMGNKMNEGMVAPYLKVIENAKPVQSGTTKNQEH